MYLFILKLLIYILLMHIFNIISYLILSKMLLFACSSIDKTLGTIEHAQVEFFYFDNQGTTWYNRLGLFKHFERMKSSLYEHL